MFTFRARIAWFGVYMATNLGIIIYSIWHWTMSRPDEAIFVGLWLPVLNLLYVMFFLTFDRNRPEKITTSSSNR